MYEFSFSQAARRLKISEIRELMKLTANPDLILFGGGMPSPKLFPYQAVAEITREWDAKKAAAAFQYCPTPGLPILQEALIKWITKHHIDLTDQTILATTGAQQALSLVARVLIDPGSTIVVENPTFVGAVASFLIEGARVTSVKMDDDGVILDDLESIFKKENPRFFYTIPTFQNPSGLCMSQAKRTAVLELAKKYGVLIIEDDPYQELYYEGIIDDYLSIKTQDKDNMVVNLGTFSKILSPGMRVGWMIGAPEFVNKCEITKQSQDACGASYTQMICADYINSGRIYPALDHMRDGYRLNRDRMRDAISANFPGWIKVSQPKGGFFFWLDLDNRLGSKDFFHRCIARGVAIITGHPFVPDPEGERYCRICFSSSSPDQIDRGIEIMGQILKNI